MADLDELITLIGEAGRRLCDIGACEGAAGNVSVCVRRSVLPGPGFPEVESVPLPVPMPELAGATFLVTGSGQRLREIQQDPLATLGCLVVDPGGQTARLHASPKRRFTRLTSELGSHLAVHYDRLLTSGAELHALVHAHPPYLTYLSHVRAYADEGYLNRRLMRWQPETIVMLPDGLGVVPFQVPGSPALMADTVASLRNHLVVVWCKHGVVARSEVSVQQALDRIEYAETAARYEQLNLAAGEPADGFSDEELRAICRAFDVRQTLLDDWPERQDPRLF